MSSTRFAKKAKAQDHLIIFMSGSEASQFAPLNIKNHREHIQSELTSQRKAIKDNGTMEKTVTGIVMGDASMQESESKEQTTAAQERPPLNKLNWLNLFFYVFNIVFTYGVGNIGWFGNGTNSELSDKYQSLVTPDSSAFIIWAVIFVFQALFAILQLLPRYRGIPMVQQGVGYWYILACIFQVAWTFAFAYEVIWLSLVFILLILVSLAALLYSQYYTESNGTLIEFWLFRFPFALHCGWLTAASLLNVNVVVVDSSATPDVELAVGIISLAILHAVSVWVLFGFRRPNYTIAGILSWANGWIYAELQDPQDSIVSRFDSTTISGVSYAACAVAIIIAGQIVVRFGSYLIAKYLLDKDETDTVGEQSQQLDEESSSEARV